MLQVSFTSVAFRLIGYFYLVDLAILTGKKYLFSVSVPLKVSDFESGFVQTKRVNLLEVKRILVKKEDIALVVNDCNCFSIRTAFDKSNACRVYLIGFVEMELVLV
jgi:hypothetical protein